MSKRERMAKVRAPVPELGESSHSAPEHRALDFVQRHSGQPLDHATRTSFEPQFGHSFADIRVHNDAESAQVAEGVNAGAVTIGQDIVFNNDRYAPETGHGNRLLGHELAHAVQNRNAGSSSVGSMRSNPEDTSEIEAREAGRASVAGDAVQVSAAPGAAIAADDKEPTPEDDRAADLADWKFAHRDVDQGMTEAEKKRTGGAKALTDNPAKSAGREQSLYGEAGALNQLTLYDTTRAEGGVTIKNFESAYNTFRLPMQMTMGALGRVQDLLTAGAPQTPQEMSKAQRSVFEKLQHTQKGALQGSVYGGWADHMSQFDQSMNNYMAVYTRLQGALLAWRGAKEKITAKEDEARMKGKMDKLKELQEPAKTIVEIVEVVEGAVSVYQTLSPKPEALEAPVSDEVKALPGGEPTELDTSAKTKGQRAYEPAMKTKEFGEKTASAGKLSLESVIEWAMGDSDEIAGLQASISLLKSQIAAADERADEFGIEAAAKTLEGTQKEFKGAAYGLGAERVKAREGAERFAGYMGDTSVDSRLITLCAEAYQELRTVADQAKVSFAPVAGTLQGVMKFLNEGGHANEIKIARQHQRAEDEKVDGAYIDNDYSSLLAAAQSANTFGQLMESEYKAWEQRANAWAQFFTVETGAALDEFNVQRHQQGG